MIDGVTVEHKKEINKIEIDRLLLVNGEHASIPIVTYLPLKEGELKN